MSVHAPGTRWYNAVWRWHFYAGLLVLPFLMLLALTGGLYLFKAEIDAGWLFSVRMIGAETTLPRPSTSEARRRPVTLPEA